MANPTGINQYTRAQGHAALHTAINKGLKGVNASMTKAAYRSVAAKAIVNNRKALGAMGISGKMKTELLYKTAAATVQVKKAEYAQFAKKLAPIHRNK